MLHLQELARCARIRHRVGRRVTASPAASRQDGKVHGRRSSTVEPTARRAELRPAVADHATRGRYHPRVTLSPEDGDETSDRRRWAVELFRKSVLKQRKVAELVPSLGPTEGLRCLDLGSDNGVVSLLLRGRGGTLGVGRPHRGSGPLHPGPRGDGRAPRRGGPPPLRGRDLRPRGGRGHDGARRGRAGLRPRARPRHEARRAPRREHAPSQAHPLEAAPPRDRPDGREARPPPSRLHAGAAARAPARVRPGGPPHLLPFLLRARGYRDQLGGGAPRQEGLGERDGGHGRRRRAAHEKMFRALFRSSTLSSGWSRAWTPSSPRPGTC